MVPLEEILRERQEVPSAEALANGGIRIVAKIGFNDGQIHLRNGSETKTGMILVRPGDLLISGINAAKGAIAIYGEENTEPIAATIHYGAYIPNKSRVEVRFLWWLLRSNTFRDLLLRYVPGGIKTELKAKRLLPIPVPLPSVEEQRRIVAKIEELTAQIHEARMLRQHAIEEADALVKAHLNRLFGNPYEQVTGTLTIREWRKLGEVVDDVADGPHVTPIYVENGIPFITVLNITSGRIRFGEQKFVTEEDHRQFQKRAKAERGDVLITKDGTIGIPCFVDTDREFSFFVSVALIKPRREILDGKFLTWAIRAPYLQERISERSRGDMIRHLVLREIRDLTVPVPLLSEQRQIVVELAALQAEVDTLKKLQAETAAELNALLLSILDKAFKGEL
ncbi:MAG: restriction endonuclease subunit S [Deltaproteobacteria bacterium]|nr:restriction endonuclease subunit S [Deltaproteobacteria bacterium]